MKETFFIFVAFTTVLSIAFFLKASEKPTSPVEVGETNAIPVESGSAELTQGRIVATRRYFRPPNTEWKTRTITLDDGRTLTYEFGKGNPVALGDTIEKIQRENRECLLLERDDIKDVNAIPRMCREGMNGYVTPEVELALKEVLSDPRWDAIRNLCASSYQKSPYYNEIRPYLNTPDGLDISNFLIIDTKTGRKELDTQYIYILTRALANAGNYSDDTGWSSSCMRAQGIEELYSLLQEPQALYSANLVDIVR